MIEDKITRLMCCMLGAINVSYIEGGLEPPAHTFLSWEYFPAPQCAAHEYATVKWDGCVKSSANFNFGENQVAHCLSRGLNIFTIRVGACAPPSLGLLIATKTQCDHDLYGHCPSCDTDLTVYDPTPPSSCVDPIGCNPDTGELIWPPLANKQSYSDHTRHLLYKAQLLKAGFRRNFCECTKNCYQGASCVKKVSVQVGEFTPWCEGQLAGIDFDIGVLAD